jgi:hypothetical protein
MVRYLLLGGAVGGGASIARQYEEWKQKLPDTAWIKVIDWIRPQSFQFQLID